MQKLYRNKYQVNIDVKGGSKDFTKNTLFPIKWASLLDEQLDESSLTLLDVEEKNFKPFSKVEIKIWNEQFPDDIKTLYFVVSSDIAKELPVGSGKYKHILTLIEETKYLERFIVRSHGYVNSILKNYTKSYVSATDLSTGGFPGTPIVPRENVYFTPITERAMQIENPLLLFNDSITSVPGYSSASITGGGIYVQYLTDEGVLGARETVVSFPTPTPWNYYTYEPRQGVFNLVYDFTLRVVITAGDNQDIQTAQISYSWDNLVAVATGETTTKWNARSVIERVLAIAELKIKEFSAPRFRLNSPQATEFEKIETPEFSFTQSTLREILQTIGHYIHGEPRLRGGTIYYDMYGSDEYNAVDVSNYSEQTFSQTIDQYATRLVSNVDNLINSIDFVSGAITEPYDGGASYNGFKTLRTETLYARIEDGNAIINTQFPIYAITELKWRGNEQNNNTVVDITPYVYESTEYERLTSFGNYYPLSRKYALYYTQGERNIKGLWFKREKAWGQPYEDYSITSILKKASGVDLSFTEVNEQNGVASTYPQLAFQVTYVPIYAAQITQTKSYIGDFDEPSSLSYNQGQNLVEASYYGENLKGVIARMGNIEKTVCYVRWGAPILPKIGTLYDDEYYISTISVEVQPYTTKVVLGLSKDFNRLSQYIGINSLKRFYEISERQAIESHLSYNDYVVIGNAPGWFGTKEPTLVDYDVPVRALTGIVSALRPSGVLVEGHDKNEETCGRVLLPTITSVVGNSIVITAKMEDNYSAGQQAIRAVTDNVTGYWAKGVPYKDWFGEIETLSLQYFRIIFNQTQDQRLALPSASGIVAEDSVLQTPNFNPNSEYYRSTDGELLVKVGSTEVPTINYELTYVTDRQNIIIGKQLLNRNPLATNSGYVGSLTMYILPKRLNKFSSEVDLNGATEVGVVSLERGVDQPNAWYFIEQTAPVSGKSWAIVDGNGRLILGCNRDVAQGEGIQQNLWISTVHTINNI